MPGRLGIALLSLLLLALPFAGCGGDEEEVLDVIEGEPIEADDVSYNVVISRFLNPDDEEDSAYLSGQPEPPPGEDYFGVFMQVENDRDETVSLPDEMRVIDTLDTVYDPLESDSPYALPLGAPIEAEGSYPVANSVAADGPTQGALVLFLVEQTSTENRPLELEIPLPSGKVGVIELDI
jgi:hypothetical protein